MQQIVYISTSRAEVPSMAQVEDILASSRRNNKRDELSGLLIVGGRRFLQVLEGPGHMLDLAYTRIKQDPRHFALVELSRRDVAARAFPDWAMGYEAGDEELLPLVTALTERVDDLSLKAQLRTFAELHSKAA